jgi:WD40 repeat protein
MKTLCGLGLVLVILTLSVPARPEPASKLDRYGDLLPEGVVARLGTVRLRGPGVGPVVAYSPDGKRIATGDSTGIALWDARTGAALSFLPLSTQAEPLSGYTAIRSLAFSADGRDLVGVFEGGHAVHWPLGGNSRRLVEAGFEPLSATFMPDGQQVIVVGSKEIRVVDIGTGLVTRCWRDGAAPPPGRVHTVTFADAALSPDGKVLAVTEIVVMAGRCGDLFSRPVWLRLFDVASGEELVRLDIGAESVAFSADGQTLAVQGDDMIRLLDPSTGTIRSSWPAASDEHYGLLFGTPKSLAFSHDGRWLAVGGSLYDVASGEMLRDLRFVEYGNHLGASFSPDGRQVAVTCGSTSVVQVQETLTGRPIFPFAAHSARVDRLHALPGGRTLASLDEDGGIRLWNPRTGESLRNSYHPGDQRWTFGGRWVAAGNEEQIVVREVETDRVVQTFPYPNDRGALALSEDGSTLATGSTDEKRVIKVYDLKTGRLRCRLPKDEQPLTTLVLSSDGSSAAGIDLEFNLRIWDARAGRLLHHVKGAPQEERPNPDVHALAMSPDGRLLVSSGTSDTSLLLWDSRTGRLLNQTTAHPAAGPDQDGRIVGLAFSPDGRLLCTSGQDGWFRVWEVASLRERCRCQADPGCVAFVAGGLLATSHRGTDVLIRDCVSRVEPLPGKASDLWADLAAESPQRGARAVRGLLARPREAVAWLGDNLRAVQVVDPARLRKLIADLDAENFETREAATRELTILGDQAEAALREAEKVARNPEQRRRVTELLARHVGSLPPERLRILRAIEALEEIATPEARAILDRVAKGLPGAEETIQARAALARLRDAP